MSPDEQSLLAMTTTPKLPSPRTLAGLLMLLVLPLQAASSGAHAESRVPQLYVKSGDTFVPLDGRFAVVPLDNVLERKSHGGRRKECMAACLRDRAPSRTGRSLGFNLETPPSIKQQMLENGAQCIIKTTQVKMYYGQCHVAGGIFPYCISEDSDGREPPIVDFFSRDCASTPTSRVDGWISDAPKKEISPGAPADAETELLPSHSVLLTSKSEASLSATTTQAEAAVINDASAESHHDAAQT